MRANSKDNKTLGWGGTADSSYACAIELHNERSLLESSRFLCVSISQSAKTALDTINSRTEQVVMVNP